MSDEKLEFPRSLLVLGLLAWVGLASVSVAVTNVLYGWVFLVFVAAIVFLILRRTGAVAAIIVKRARQVLVDFQDGSSETATRKICATRPHWHS